MRLRSVVYPSIFLYEIFRLFLLTSQDIRGGIAGLPVSWYAGIPLLCLTPALILMILLDEPQFAAWLPLVALVKALGIPSLLAYAIHTLPDAFTFALSGDLTLGISVLAVVFCVLADALVGIYCYRRNRTLCK